MTTAPTSQPLLVVEDLQTTFHTARGAVRAVDGVSLHLMPGETLGLVGESGSGKSVLGRSVMGLLETGRDTTVAGTVALGGRDVHALPRKARRRLWGPEVAMVFQDPMTSLNPVKRIGTHLTETLREHTGCGRAEARHRAVELLRRVGIPEPARRSTQYPHELSGGMRQRVVIAAALAGEPRLLIADEPTTALDVTVQRQILDLLQGLVADTGMAMLLISHDLGAIAGRTDRVQVMYAGRTVEAGATGQVFSRPKHPYTRGLLASVPDLGAPPHSRLATIDGTPPRLTDLTSGCRFAPRCPQAAAVCIDTSPVLTARDGATVACHLPLLPGAATTPELTHGR